MSIYRALQVAFYRGKIVFFTTYGDALPYIAFVAENCYNNSCYISMLGGARNAVCTTERIYPPNFMHYVYVLHSAQDGNLYVGCTNDLQRRIREHERGNVPSTRNRRPLNLVHYEAFTNQADAFGREKWYKTGWGKTHLQKMLSNTLKILAGYNS